MTGATAAPFAEQPTKIRWLIVAILFIVSAINYADRSILSLATKPISQQFHLNNDQMGWIFSAFGWAYVVGQLPGGYLLDRFGSKRVYFWSIFIWSIFTVAQGFVGSLTATAAVTALFTLRFIVGLAGAPSFPGNGRIVAAWFPVQERGTASAIFNSSQYFATVIFAPLIGWLVSSYGWPWSFAAMGFFGIAMSLVWLKTIYGPAEHPRANRAEVEYIAAGGGLVNLDGAKGAASDGRTWDYIRQLFSSRMMVGIFAGQYGINTITFFFITWFPVYLVQERHMSILKAGFVASVPAIFGFGGGILGGLVSDMLRRKGYSLNVARKTPIVIGMLLSVAMIGCNYTNVDGIVVALMALAFFGKGVGALGWAVVSDTAPRQITGLTGGVFNMCGNVSSITTPIIIGKIIQATGSFEYALIFVGANAVLAIVCYLFIVGDIKRMELA